MSACTRARRVRPRKKVSANTPSLPSDRPARRIGWFGISLVIHAVIFGALFIFIVPGVMRGKQEPKAPRPTVSRERVKKVHDELRRMSDMRMRQKLAALNQIKTELKKIEERKKEEYAAATAPQRENALEGAKVAMEKAIELQGRALGDLEKKGDGFDTMLRGYDELVARLEAAGGIGK